MAEQPHVIHTMKMPPKMKKRFELANMIKSYVSKAKISTYASAVNKLYAASLEQMAWHEFQYEGLKLPYGEYASYSHTIDADLNTGTLTFKRTGQKDPSIYEKLNLLINLK